MPETPEAAAADMARWAEDLEHKAQQYRDLHGHLAALSVTHTSPDGHIAVTVDGNGIPTAFRLEDDVRSMRGDRIAATLMRCMQGAQAELRSRVGELVQDAVGDDEAGTAIIDQYADRFPDLPNEAETP